MRQAVLAVVLVFVIFCQVGLAEEARTPPPLKGEKSLTLKLADGVEMRLVLIPAGKFKMGSPANEKGRDKDEGPQRAVTISKPFYMNVCEVTQAQYNAVMGANPSGFKGANRPVEQVSWNDAVTFSKKVSQKTGRTVSLPTEAEWEYACRAGTTTCFSFGADDKDLGDYAWYRKNSGGKTHPVGQKKPNAWGLYDMHGNVWEWCSDWYAKSYAKLVDKDPRGPKFGFKRVLRGGSWNFNAALCRSARRTWWYPARRFNYFGFRVVLRGGVN